MLKVFFVFKIKKWEAIFCETHTKMEVFKSNGSFCNFNSNLPKTFFIQKMSKNKAQT